MDQTAHNTAAQDLHPEADVRRQRRNISVLIGNLKAAGLNMPGVDTAYRAALFAGATDEMAWEAARRHELAMIGFPDEISDAGTDLSKVEAMRKRRQALIDTCRALPNPFALRSDLQVAA
ncbi:hypothetical protein [Stenotrophomonas maltophilia]|uniref:hypothetical protein n=1 Tax=Stenotrophomonas maltophilia TaxID=40324 RepID=UPI000C2607CF|nr:hypothetical protein [Stenotrophomonas maltophilia]PJL44719.1 hypothetical protein B9Y56_08520 [Stenotrophomonas maltophilia]